MHAKWLQWCLTLCDPRRLPGSSVHGILQTRRLECVATPTPGDLLPNTGIEPVCLVPSALVGRFFITSTIWEVTCLQVEHTLHTL